MGIGTGVFLLALGAICTFAVTAGVAGISLDVVGVILMITGAVSLVAGVLARRRTGEHAGGPRRA